jgi:hypothetical protein
MNVGGIEIDHPGKRHDTTHFGQPLRWGGWFEARGFGIN